MTEKFIKMYMNMARSVAESNTACYSRQIGSVIVSKDHKVLGVGYNGPPTKVPHMDSEDSLNNFFWPQLTDEEKIKLLKDNGLHSEAINYKDLDSQKDVALYNKADCKQCPRKMIDAGPGERSELCNCLSEDSLIIMSDGYKKKIKDVVRNKINGEVKSFDLNTNKIVNKKILDWFETTRKVDYWYQLETDNTAARLSGFYAAKFTPDHEILMANGEYVEIQHLSVGDKIMSSDLLADGDTVEKIVKIPCFKSVNTYCIEVEDTNNFFTENCIVHNCQHSERNAITNAQTSLKDSIIFCWCPVPCIQCAGAIINAGISEIHCLKADKDYQETARYLCERAGIKILEYDINNF